MMAPLELPTPISTHLDAQRALLCPGCGYDLRALASERCPECGLVIDLDSLRTSGIPWAHRRRIGLARAWFKTALAFMLDRRFIRHEAAKPQDPADGRAFSRITALFIAMALCTLFAVIVWNEGWHSMAIRPDDPYSSPTSTPGWIIDLAVPWCAGAVLRPVLPIGLLLLAFHLASVQRTIFRCSGPPEHRRSAVAIASYTTAPLALAPLVVLGLLVALAPFDEDHSLGAGSKALIISADLLALSALLFTIIRMVQWLRRTMHCGLLSALIRMSELALLWLVGLVLFLGVLPWCAGLIWIVIDSFRG